MSDKQPGPEFWERANAIVNLANEQCKSAHSSEVSASSLYAVARFNAFIVASGLSSGEEMKLERDNALEYFTEQFRKMLSVNLDDFIENYAKYSGRQPG